MSSTTQGPEPDEPAIGVFRPVTSGRRWTAQTDELALEVKLRTWAPPAALVLALLFHASALGHFLQRTFLSMYVHELGHAVCAWYCGYFAFPIVWQTMISPSRGAGTPLLMLALHGWGVWKLRQTEHPRWAVLVGALGGVFLLGMLTSRRTAEVIFTFGGDGGAMVLGTIGIITFFAPRDHHLVKSWLRWGFLVIGAAAYVDTFSTWWRARHDWDAIPFGEIEGVGLSDPSRLTDLYGWTTKQLVGRYVALGTVCFLALVATWAWAILRARRDQAAGVPASPPTD